MEETEPLRRYYIEHFDTPEKRLRDKTRIRFGCTFEKRGIRVRP